MSAAGAGEAGLPARSQPRFLATTGTLAVVGLVAVDIAAVPAVLPSVRVELGSSSSGLRLIPPVPSCAAASSRAWRAAARSLASAGRSEIMKLFPRDESRSVYSTPQRFLAMVCVTGVPMQLPYAPWVTPVKFNFFAEYGEAFWVPWYSKGKQPCWGMLTEAKAGGPFDRFRECRSAEELLRTKLELIRRYPLPGSPYGIAIDNVRHRMYVTQTARNQLTELIAGGRPSLVARYATPPQPNTVAVDETTGRVAVTGKVDGVLQLLDPDRDRAR